MRALMNVIKDRHGTYYARRKVPQRLQEAVARILDKDKAKQVWLKKSLGTKVLAEANVRAKPVQMEFDRVFAQAEAQLKERPLRTSISDVEIKRIADYFYATEVAADEELRVDGRGDDPVLAKVHRQLTDAGVQFTTPCDVKALTLEPGRGLSLRMMHKIGDDTADMLSVAEDDLARGDITHIRWEVDELLKVFQVNLDRSCDGYRKLARAVLAAHVRQLRAVLARQKGEPIDTPPIPQAAIVEGATGGTLRAAFEGWKRQRERPLRTLDEYERAIRLFVELHGDLPVVQIKKSHARQFREALQDVPRKRTGKLLNASLPEVAEHGRKHPEVQKISAATVNKLLGGVQTVAVWAGDNGMVPDDMQWADPFARMRLSEGEPDRAPFDLAELRVIFSTPVFTGGERPVGGKSDAAFWLPLLALFSGARRSELTGLRPTDVAYDKVIGATSIYITADRKTGKRLKTRQSARVVPLHPELDKLGFLDFVAAQAKERGQSAWLFPQVAPGTAGEKAWSKWFGRYIGAHGVNDTAKVFHSFRHNFIDALRAANVNGEINAALVGHSIGNVHASYGAKEIARRFGRRLAEAVAAAAYEGLDLSHLRTPETRSQTRLKNRQQGEQPTRTKTQPNP
jgi:integrase